MKGGQPDAKGGLNWREIKLDTFCGLFQAVATDDERISISGGLVGVLPAEFAA